VTEYAAQAVPIRLPWGTRLLLVESSWVCKRVEFRFLRNEVLVVENDNLLTRNIRLAIPPGRWTAEGGCPRMVYWPNNGGGCPDMGAPSYGPLVPPTSRSSYLLLGVAYALTLLALTWGRPDRPMLSRG
jgi:hypothetical protein